MVANKIQYKEKEFYFTDTNVVTAIFALRDGGGYGFIGARDI